MYDIHISPAVNLEEYLKIWKRSMEDLYWAKNHYLMDFTMSEEIDEIRSDWSKEGSQFLIARDSNENPLGIVGYRFGEQGAQIRRWEPALISSSDKREIRAHLLEDSLDRIRNHGCSFVIHRIKHPYGKPQSAQHLFELYTSAGFKRMHPDAVGMLTRLEKSLIKEVNEPTFELHYAHEFSEA